MDRPKQSRSHSWKVTQVGIVVKDLDRVIAALSSYGIGPFEPKILPEERKEWYRGKPMDARLRLAGAKIGDTEIELIQPIEGGSPHMEFLESKGEGIQHIMVAVDDFTAEFERMVQKGATVLLHAKFPARELAYLDLHAGGLIIELVQKREGQ